jgi:hypothetical protein
MCFLVCSNTWEHPYRKLYLFIPTDRVFVSADVDILNTVYQKDPCWGGFGALEERYNIHRLSILDPFVS